MEREIPHSVEDKYSAWRFWTGTWNTIHYTTGFTSAALSSVIAANVKLQFLGATTATFVAAFAAGLAFLLTAFGAQSRASKFERAARELEIAKSLYQLDPNVPESTLADAIRRGIQILKD